MEHIKFSALFVENELKIRGCIRSWLLRQQQNPVWYVLSGL